MSLAVIDWAEAAARAFEPPPPAPLPPQWDSPADLAAAIAPGTVQTAALDVIDGALLDVAEGRCTRLIICMPPQEGKSTRVSMTFPLWMLTRNPDLRIAIVSYGQDLANTFGREIRNNIASNDGDEGALDLGLRIATDNGSVSRWSVEGRKGGVRAVGIGGGLTGRPADMLIIDDPLANMEQAQSQTYRDRAWNFWTSTGATRLAPGAPVIVVLTRWHEDDLAGRLLAADDGHLWRVVSIPAIADSPNDPLGREIGEAMESARGERDWDAIRVRSGDYVWGALYQQHPSPAAGGLFKRADLQYWARPAAGDTTHPRPAIMLGAQEVYIETLWRFITCDLAISKRTSADYTAVGAWGVTMDGQLVLLDGVRSRLGEDEHFAAVNQLRTKWGIGKVYVEAAQHGTTLVWEAGQAGVPVEKLVADADKFTRALPASARAGAHKLWLPAVAHAPWVQDWVDELAAFPNGAHDDTVDVVAYAARVAATHWLPMMPHDLEMAYTAVTPPELDMLAIPY